MELFWDFSKEITISKSLLSTTKKRCQLRALLSILKILYALLLRLFPRQVREEFSGEMLANFLDMAEDVSRKGVFPFILFCLRELIDFPMNLFRIHIKEGYLFRILRSQPINHALRGVLGYGVVFGLTILLVSSSS